MKTKLRIGRWLTRKTEYGQLKDGIARDLSYWTMVHARAAQEAKDSYEDLGMEFMMLCEEFEITGEQFERLQELNSRAAKDLGTLMSACVDYRNTLIRACVPDPVSGLHEGVEEIFKRYGVEVTKRPLWGATNIFEGTIKS